MRTVAYVVGSCLLAVFSSTTARAQSSGVSGSSSAQDALPAGASSAAVPGPSEAPLSEAKPPPAGPQPRIVPEAAPLPPPPAAPLEKAVDTIGNLVRFYGTLKPTVIASVGSLESFSQPNASAETAAGNPALATLPKDTRGTFQMAQSRIGFFIAEKSKARGQLEFDFVDFTKASPTVASLPRLRIAKVEWEPIDRLVIGVGQDWDLYGPMNPYGSNLVGANFLAGNTGFMRQQVKAVFTVPDAVELGLALGLQGVNATAKDGAVELARVPTVAVRGAALFGKSRVGISGIATQLRLNPGAATERRTGAYGGQVYADVDVSSVVHFKGEGYVGRNLAAIGALALAQPSTASGDLDEIGGFVSAKAQADEHHAVYVTVGAAQILNPSHVVPSYAYAAATTPGGALGAAALAGTGPGMRFNMSARVGYEYRPVKPLAFVFEAFLYRSRHVLVPSDVGTFDVMRNVPGLEIAALYTF